MVLEAGLCLSTQVLFIAQLAHDCLRMLLFSLNEARVAVQNCSYTFSFHDERCIHLAGCGTGC